MKRVIPWMIGLMLIPGFSKADCIPSTKDINQDGVVDVLDAVCSMESLLARMFDEEAPLPACAAIPNLDTDCNGITDLVDAAIIISAIVGEPLPIQVDATGNQCPDACDASPITPGAFLPQWELEDLQPDSETFGMLTGPKAGPGVRVIILLDGG